MSRAAKPGAQAGAQPASSCRLRCAVQLALPRCALPAPAAGAPALPRLQMAFPGGQGAALEYYEMVEAGGVLGDAPDGAPGPGEGGALGAAPQVGPGGVPAGGGAGDRTGSGGAAGTPAVSGATAGTAASPGAQRSGDSRQGSRQGARASASRGAHEQAQAEAPAARPRLLASFFTDVDIENPQALIQSFLVETMKLRFEPADGKERGKAAASKAAPAPQDGLVASIDLAPLVVDLPAKQDFFLRAEAPEGLCLTGRIVVRLLSSRHELPVQAAGAEGGAKAASRPSSAAGGAPGGSAASADPAASGPRYQRVTTFLPRSLTTAGSNPFLFRIVSMSDLPVAEDREWREAYLQPARMTTTVLGIECASGEIPQGLFGGRGYGAAEARPRGTRYVFSDEVPIRVHCTYTCKGPEDCQQLRRALLEDVIRIEVRHRVPGARAVGQGAGQAGGAAGGAGGSSGARTGQKAGGKASSGAGAAASAADAGAANLSDQLSSVEFCAVAEVSLKSLAAGDRVYDAWVPLKPVFRNSVTGENLDLSKASELVRGRLPASLLPGDASGAAGGLGGPSGPSGSAGSANAAALAEAGADPGPSFRAAQTDPATLPLGDWSRARIRVVAALAAPLPAPDAPQAAGSPLRSRPPTSHAAKERSATAEKEARESRDSRDSRDASLVLGPRPSPEFQSRRWFERAYFILSAGDLASLRLIIRHVCTTNLNFVCANNAGLAASLLPSQPSSQVDAQGGSQGGSQAGQPAAPQGPAAPSTPTGGLPPLGKGRAGEAAYQRSASRGRLDRSYTAHAYTDGDISARYSLLAQNTISSVFSGLSAQALASLRPEHSLDVAAITGWAFWDPAFQIVFLEAPAALNLIAPLAQQVSAQLPAPARAQPEGAELPPAGTLDQLTSPSVKVGPNVRFRKRCAPGASLGLSRLCFVRSVGELAEDSRSWTSESASLEARRALETLLGLTVMSTRETAPEVDALGRSGEPQREPVYAPTPQNLRQIADAGLFLGDAQISQLRNWAGGVLPGQLDIASVMTAKGPGGGRFGSPRAGARCARGGQRGAGLRGALEQPLSLESLGRQDGMEGLPDPAMRLKAVLTDVRVVERKGALRRAREDAAARSMESAIATARAARQSDPEAECGAEGGGEAGGRSPRGSYPRTLRPFWDSPEVWSPPAAKTAAPGSESVPGPALATHLNRAAVQPEASRLAATALQGTELLSKPASMATASRAAAGGEVYLYSSQALGAARLSDLGRGEAQQSTRGFVYARDCYRRPTLDVFQPEYSARGTPEYAREKAFNKTPNLKTDGWRRDPRLQVHPARADLVREEWDEAAIALLNSEGGAREPDSADPQLRGRAPFRLRVAPREYLDQHPENMLGIIHADEEYEEALRRREKAEWREKMVVDRPYLEFPHATPMGRDGRAANGGIVEPLRQEGPAGRPVKYSIRLANRHPVVTTRTPSLASQEPYPEAEVRTFDAMLAASKPVRLAPLEERHPEVLQKMVEIASSSVLRYDMPEDEDNDTEESKRAKRRALREAAGLELERYTKSLRPEVYAGCDMKAASERVRAAIRTNGGGLEELQGIVDEALERKRARDLLAASALPSARARAAQEARGARRARDGRTGGAGGAAGAPSAPSAARTGHAARDTRTAGGKTAADFPAVADDPRAAELDAARARAVHPMRRTTTTGAASYSPHTSGAAARLLDRTVSLEGSALKY